MHPTISFPPPPRPHTKSFWIGVAASTGSLVGTCVPSHHAAWTLPLFAVLLCRGTTRSDTIIIVASLFCFITFATLRESNPNSRNTIINSPVELTCTIDEKVHARGSRKHVYKGSVLRASNGNEEVWINTPHPLNVNRSLQVVVSGWFRAGTHGKPPTLFVQHPAQIKTKTTPSNSPTLRECIVIQLTSGLNEHTKPLSLALFLGIRGDCLAETTLLFQRAGMSHILAISGLHIAIFVGLVLFIAKVFQCSQCIETTLVFLTLGACAICIEPSPSVIRAIAMVGVFYLLRSCGVKTEPLSVLGIVATLLLLVNPLESIRIGFWLTFCIVYGLIVYCPNLSWQLLPKIFIASKLNKAKRWVQQSFVVSLCAWLVAAPFVACAFHIISPSGLLTAIPSLLCLCAVLITGSIHLMTPIGTILNDVSGTSFNTTLELLLTIAEIGANAPLGHTTIQSVNPLLMSIYIGTLLTLTRWQRVKRKLFVLFSTLVCMVLFPSRNHTTLMTLNVGHGAAHLLHHNDVLILIDGGSATWEDVGLERIIPELQSNGHTVLDAIIVSHGDIDHCAGLLDIVQHVGVGAIYISVHEFNNPSFMMEQVLKAAGNRNIPIYQLAVGDTIDAGSIIFRVHHPQETEQSNSRNSESLVLSTTLCNNNIVFTGDIGGDEIQSALVGLSPDIIELPHHGSWNMVTQQFLDETRPAIILQSTSLSRHKHDKWCIPEHSERYNTAVDGTIRLMLSPTGQIDVSTRHFLDSMVK